MPPTNNSTAAIAAPGSGFAQRLLAAGMQVHELRAHAATLRDDEWTAMDEALVPAAVQPLRAAQDLLDAGLTRDLRARGFGVLLDQWEDVSRMDAAVIDMDADTPPNEGRQEFNKHAVPMPVIHKGFRLGIRQLTASRERGEAIDVTSGAAASRVIGEGLEGLVINGSEKVSLDGHKVYGYTTHPQRNTGNFVAWTDGAATPVDDVLSMINDAHNAKHHGPFWLYLPPNYSTVVEDDYSAQKGTRTLRQRLMDIEGIDRVRTLWQLADDNLLLVQATRDVVDLAVAVDPQPVEWEGRGGLTLHFEMLQIAAPRVKADADGNSGIVHYFPAT